MDRFKRFSLDGAIAGRLEELLGVRPNLSAGTKTGAAVQRPDYVVRTGPRTFVVEYKASGDAAAVGRAVVVAQGFAAALKRKAIPMVAVGYMGEVGRSICEQAGVAWFDLSGNAHIVLPGLRIHVEGRPNRFKRPGRPGSVFAPKSARLVRLLLTDPGKSFSQRDLSRTAGISEGFTSRIVRRLEEQRLVVRDERGAVRARDPVTLLDAWREAYDFSRHSIVRGHVAARSGEDLLRRVAGAFVEFRQPQGYALTGLGAAWLLSRFAAFRTAAFYLKRPPEEKFLKKLGFRHEPEGANLWLVVPNDEGVFDGGLDGEGIHCVSRVQVFMDLKDQPERSAEAAARLRGDILAIWRRRAR